MCHTGTAACSGTTSYSKSVAAGASASKSTAVVTAKGAPMSVDDSTAAGEYVVIVSSREVSKASVHVAAEPCAGGQSSWRAFCLPVVVTLGASTVSNLRTLQGGACVLRVPWRPYCILACIYPASDDCT